MGTGVRIPVLHSADLTESWSDNLITRAIFLTVVLAASACGGSSTSASNLPPTSVGTFTITDLTIGTGATAASGNTVTVNYAGWLYDTTKPFGKGSQFDPGAAPLTFLVGGAGVIGGFSQGVVGMKVGGQRRVIIPPEQAYGATTPDGSRIPPNATLVFEMTLTSVQ
jgi:FKBP-type peptidyl-prolyl cis-trans isomerase FkpA